MIYYPLAVDDRYGFTTDPGKWLRYVIIDPSRQRPDGMTLAHEMGHAATVKDHKTHHGLDNHARPNALEDYEKENHIYRPIMSYVTDRNRFSNHEVADFAKCYFRK